MQTSHMRRIITAFGLTAALVGLTLAGAQSASATSNTTMAVGLDTLASSTPSGGQATFTVQGATETGGWEIDYQAGFVMHGTWSSGATINCPAGVTVTVNGVAWDNGTDYKCGGDTAALWWNISLPNSNPTHPSRVGWAVGDQVVITWPSAILTTPASATPWTATYYLRSPYTGTVTFTQLSPSGGEGTDQTPPPWMQSYGRQKSDTCKAGWNPSWAEWAVSKTGGWVCNRTVYWNGSGWSQNPAQSWGTWNAAQSTTWDGK